MKRNFSNESASTKSMSRRAFLGGSAVAFGTVMLSSAMGACSAPETSEGRGAGASANSEQVLYELYDTDILIIGGGLAGSHAALQAYKQGKDVAVVEKAAFHFGGACGYNWCNWVNFIQADTPWDQSEDFVLNELTNKKIAKATHEAFTPKKATTCSCAMKQVRLCRASISRAIRFSASSTVSRDTLPIPWSVRALASSTRP